MPDQVMTVTASPGARSALHELTERIGDLVIVQSAGCCDGSAPMVLRAVEYPLGPADVQVGDIDGAPVVIHARELTAWKHGDLEIDVEPGYADGLSYPAGDGLHFVSRFTACPSPTSRS